MKDIASMKAYEIANGSRKRPVGVLLHYPKQDEYVIELDGSLDEWSAPLLFAELTKQGTFTIPRDLSRTWVESRVVPPDRQNIGDILSNHRLESYDAMRLLELANGRCSQDNLHIRRIHALPDYAAERASRNLVECTPCKDDSLLCFFADETVRKVDFRRLREESEGETKGTIAARLSVAIEKILRNRTLFESASITAGGYAATFGDVIDISARVLYQSGIAVPLSLSDFRQFVKKSTVDTSESCAILECSRQNLAYLQSKHLGPIRENVKGSLYLRGDVLQSRW